MKCAIVNGPNLGTLGRRQPHIYGNRNWEEIFDALQERFKDSTLVYFQSNHEGAVIDYIEDLSEQGVEGLVINPGAWTHQSYAIRDALAALSIPIIEVHISNIYAREGFRAHSVIAPVVTAQVSGFGVDGYRLALAYLCEAHL